MHTDFDHVVTWVFDLDNTLYPPQMRLFDQIDEKMVIWVMNTLGVDREEANALRQLYYAQYGTTLAGLMDRHDMAPQDFLIDVHDISFDVLSPDPDLRDLIDALPGRRIIYTNGTAPYAQNVISARGLSGVFDAIYGVEHASYRPKPEAGAFQQVFARDGLDTTTSAMFEDEARNLAYPHRSGMRTVHVSPQPVDAPHIHHATDDLRGFLKQVLE